MLPSTLHIIWPMDMGGLTWIYQTVKEMHLKEEKETFFDHDLDLGIKVTLNIAQNPLHYVTYSPAKFEVAMSYSLGRKYII